MLSIKIILLYINNCLNLISINNSSFYSIIVKKNFKQLRKCKNRISFLFFDLLCLKDVKIKILKILKKQHINSWLINFVQSCLILILIKMLEDDSDGNARIARMMIVINRLFF